MKKPLCLIIGLLYLTTTTFPAQQSSSSVQSISTSSMGTESTQGTGSSAAASSSTFASSASSQMVQIPSYAESVTYSVYYAYRPQDLAEYRDKLVQYILDGGLTRCEECVKTLYKQDPGVKQLLKEISLLFARFTYPPPSMPPSQWENKDVCTWLTSFGDAVGRYSEQAESSQINGEQLMKKQEQQIINEWHINPGLTSKKLHVELEALKRIDFLFRELWGRLPLALLKEDYDRKRAAVSDLELCPYCAKNKRNILFEPCSHLCLCRDCAAQFTYCPQCAIKIERDTIVYLTT